MSEPSAGCRVQMATLALEPVGPDERFVAKAEDREAFDNAWQEYSDPSKRRGSESLEEVAHKVAWAAVKKQYEKVGNEWQPKD